MDNSETNDNDDKVKKIEEKVDLLDEKIMFLFQKIKALTDKLDVALGTAVVPSRPAAPPARPVPVRPAHVQPEPIQPPAELVKAKPAYTAPSEELPVTPMKEIPVEKIVVKERPPREPFWSTIKKEEVLPYFILIAFFLLLAAVVYIVTTMLIDLEVFDNALVVFLIIGITSLGFVLISYGMKRLVDAKNWKRYYIFPWSFLALGIAGIFVAFIVSQTTMSDSNTRVVFPIAIATAIVAFIITIIFKNEFLIGEASLAFILILLVPTLTDSQIFGPVIGGYSYFIFFMIFIIGSYVLAKLKITAAPSLVSLISFPVFAFIIPVIETLELESILVVVPSCLVATLLVENAYDEFPIYNRREMRTVITIMAIVLPLSSYFFLIFMRNTAGIPSWEILVSNLFIVVTYFLTIKQILSSRFEEYDVRSPVVLETFFVTIINSVIFLSFISESLQYKHGILGRTSDVRLWYTFMGLYLILQISFAILTMTWKVEKAASTIGQSIICILFVEGLFIRLFSDSVITTTISEVYEIILSIGLAFLFVAPLVNLYFLRKQKYVVSTSASIMFLGALNLFILSFFGIGELPRSICEIVIIVVSITIGVISVLKSLDKLPFHLEEEGISLSQLNVLSILALTSSLWYIQKDELINYFIVAGIFVSVAIWIFNLFLTRKTEKHWSEEIFGIFVISLVFLSIPASLSTVSATLAILTTFCVVIAASIVPIFSTRYNLAFPVIIYTLQMISLFAFPGAPSVYGQDWLLPIVFLIPTLTMLSVSIKDKKWWTRIGTTILAATMLIITAFSLRNTPELGVFIAIDSIILVVYPIFIYLYNTWKYKEEEYVNITVEFPIDLFLTTLAAIIANFYVTTTTYEPLIFIFLVIGTILGPVIFLVNRFVGKAKELPPKINYFASVGFIFMIQILTLATAGTEIVSVYYYISILLATAIISLVIMFKEKFDSLTVLPALVSIMLIPIFTHKYTTGIPLLESVISGILLGTFIAYIVSLSIGWFDSKYPVATFSAYLVGCLGIILSTFIEDMSFFAGLPDYFPLLLFALWQIGVIVSIQLTRIKPERNVDYYLMFLFAASLISISIGQIFNINSPLTIGGLLGFCLTAFPAYLIFILLSAFLQYKVKYSNKGMIFHILVVQTLLIVVGSVIFGALDFQDISMQALSMSEILTYVFFNIFTVLLFIVLESLVIEYTLVKTDTPRSEIVNVLLFIPIYIFSLVLSTTFAYYGIVPMILGIVFYGMSQKHDMKLSSVLAALSVALSAFFITPPSQVIEWLAFGIVTGVMFAMVIIGIVLYVRTKNEFHIITTVTIGLIGASIIAFISPFDPYVMKVGLVFNLALIGMLFGVIYDIREFKIVFSVSSGILIIPFLALLIAQQDRLADISYWYLAIIFVVTAALLLLSSYITYRGQKEKEELIVQDEPKEKKNKKKK